MTSEMMAKHDRQRKIHHVASVVYHICLIVYLFCQFARSLYGANSIEGLHVTTVTLQQIIRYVLFGLCIQKCCFNPKDGFSRLGIMLIALAVSSNSNNYNHIFDFAAFALLSDLSNEKLSLRLLVPVYTLMGLVMAWMTQNGRFMDYEIFSSLGMSNPNTTAGLMLAFSIVLWKLYLRKNRILSCLFFWAVAAVMYKAVGSLTTVILTVAFPVVFIVVELIGKGKHGKILKATSFLPIFMAALSVLLMIWLGSPQFQSGSLDISNFFSRFQSATDYGAQHGISLLGAPVDKYTTDNLFLNILLCHGILGLGVIVGIQTWMMIRLLRNKQFDLLAIQVVMLVYAIMETVPMALIFNVFVAAVPGFWRTAEEKAEKTDERVAEGAKERAGKRIFPGPGKPAFLRVRIIASLLTIAVFGALAIFWPHLIELGELSGPIFDELIIALALLVLVWLFPWNVAKEPEAYRLQDEPFHDVSQNGFYWNLAILMSALVLVVFVFHWTVAGDWNFTATSTEPLNRTALLPQMDGTVEICQSMTVKTDRLDKLTVGIAVVSNTNQEEDSETEGLTVTLAKEDGTVLSEWQAIPDSAAVTDLVLNLEEPLVGLTEQRVNLLISGQQPVSLWYGNAMSAGKFEVKVESDEVLTVNGNPVDGQLILVQSGVKMHSQSRYIWPAAALLLGGVFLLLMVAHRKKLQGKPFFLNTIRAMVKKYRFLLHVLVARDFHVKYRSSSLGMIWSFLNPMFMALIYMFVFSTIFQNSIENFIVYVMTGIVLFNYFSDATNLCMLSIVGNGNLITKVYTPKYIFPISKALSSALNLVISMVPLLLIMALTGVPFQKSLLLLPIVLCFLILFTIGVGLMLSSALVFFRDIQFLWGIMVTILNFLSPVFYPESIIPAKFLPIYHLNPMYQFMYFMRSITLGGVSPQPITYIYCAAASILTLLLGIYVFRKNQDRFVLFL